MSTMSSAIGQGTDTPLGNSRFSAVPEWQNGGFDIHRKRSGNRISTSRDYADVLLGFRAANQLPTGRMAAFKTFPETRLLPAQTAGDVASQGSVFTLLNVTEWGRERAEAAAPDPWSVFEALAGSVEGPSDLAAEHDHYLYGVPKRL